MGSLRPSLNRDLPTLPLARFRLCYGEGEAAFRYQEKRPARGRNVSMVLTFYRQSEENPCATLEDTMVTAEERIWAWAMALVANPSKSRWR